MPAVAQAQNILMHKLGLAQSPHLEMDDFEKYFKPFNEELTEEQIMMIKELLARPCLAPSLGDAVEAS
jgi:hypothetical protein